LPKKKILPRWEGPRALPATRDGFTAIDASAVLPDGTRFEGPNGLRSMLLGQSEQVRCVRAGGLKPSPVASGKGFGDDLSGWLQLSKRAVLLRIEVDASGQTPESAGFGQPGEGLVNGSPAGKVDELRRREYRPSTSAFNSP